VTLLKLCFRLKFRFGSHIVDVKSYNEVIGAVGKNIGIVECNTNDTLSLREGVSDGCH